MPPTCSICYESFTSPVSLPCGHVFCRECVRRTVDSIKSAGVEHFCPTCRASYSILNVDPALIPPYLRPHILPPLRRVFFDAPSPNTTTAPGSASESAPQPSGSGSASGSVQSQSQSQPPPTPAEFGRAVAEGNALRLNCATWRRRAEVHAAANTSLLGFARAAKDCALRMRAERDAERNTCVLLKRKLAELLPERELPPDPDTTQKHAVPKPVPRAGLPVFLMQCSIPSQFYENPADMEQSHFGPPMKRRKESPRHGVYADENKHGETVDAVPPARRIPSR